MKRTELSTKLLSCAVGATLAAGMLPGAAFAQTPQSPNEGGAQGASPVANVGSLSQTGHNTLAGSSLSSMLAQVQDTSGTCGDHLYWNLSEDGKVLEISGTGKMKDYITLISPAPWSKQASAIESIVLPEGMTSIGSLAFEGCSSVKSVILPSTLKTIGASAFSGCSSLEKLAIPAEVTEVGSNAFANCTGLTRLEFASGAAAIRSNAFKSDSQLSMIVFNGNAPSINTRAFIGVSANAFYPADDPTWTADKRAQYGGKLQWSAFRTEIASVSLESPSAIYDGEAHHPAPTVKNTLGDVLTPDVDYTLSYSGEGIDAGTYEVTVSGTGAYSGSEGSASFEILPAEISLAEVAAVPDQTYTGSPATPKASISMGEKTLVEGVDYSLSYTNNTEVGQGRMTATGKGNYEGTIDASFSIVQARISTPKAVGSLVYNGQSQTGVKAGKGYSISGNTAMNAGNYTAKAVLDKQHYMWADGTQTDKAIPYSIAKAKNPMSLKRYSKTLKYHLLKNKAYRLRISFKTSPVGKVGFFKGKKAKKAGIRVSKRGKILVPKNIKKGKYGIGVRASGDINHNPTARLFVIRVK